MAPANGGHYWRGRANRLPTVAGRAIMLGRVCTVHAEHDDPVPIEDHRVRPAPRGGADASVRLCANAHGRVHALMDEIEAVALSSPFAVVDEVLRSLPDATWQSFTVAERGIAYHGWRTYGLAFLQGRYATAYRLWRTDGTAKEPDTPHFDDLYHAARWSRRWRQELDAL